MKIESFELGANLIPKNYGQDLYRIRHSTAHILAWATKEHFSNRGEVIFGVGPVTEDGFYYDFMLPHPMQEEDLVAIEELMKNLVNSQNNFMAQVIDKKNANSYFCKQPLKLEIINSIISQNTSEEPILTIFSVGGFTDLCRGPHVKSTSDIKPEAIKLLGFSSAYWKGDASKESLTRIQGTVFKSKEDLNNYLWLRAEAERRDHRKLGKQLELFHFDETAPGTPYWLPNGLTIFNELVNFCRKENGKYGYDEISTPLINKKSLWEISGHWEYYREDMYLVTSYNSDPNEVELALKPMNCPNAMVVFNLKKRSYRELPLRLSDCDTLHRNELSGAIHGLLRVRQFHQDDAHIFIKKDQIESECNILLEMCHTFYSKFNMTYTFRLSTRPNSFIGDPNVWDEAELVLFSILNKHVGEENYIVARGEGAFYGPKIDILMQDCLKRTWQMGTIQLDFQLPTRFNCRYVDKDGSLQTPVVIHRAISGSLERFIGVLIEHTNGDFPTWLAPCQIIIIPIADRHIQFCIEKEQQLRIQNIRVKIDKRSERVSSKIREAELHKIPYILVVGDKELVKDSVSCRQRSTKVIKELAFSEFQELILTEINNKSFNS